MTCFDHNDHPQEYLNLSIIHITAKCACLQMIGPNDSGENRRHIYALLTIRTHRKVLRVNGRAVVVQCPIQ